MRLHVAKLVSRLVEGILAISNAIANRTLDIGAQLFVFVFVELFGLLQILLTLIEPLFEPRLCALLIELLMPAIAICRLQLLGPVAQIDIQTIWLVLRTGSKELEHVRQSREHKAAHVARVHE